MNSIVCFGKYKQVNDETFMFGVTRNVAKEVAREQMSKFQHSKI